jgi:hypothetical protein
MRAYLLVLAACSAKPAPPAAWPVPVGWKSEDIPFPLDFAPDIKHEGVEQLRFPPGFFKADAPDYFSYAFVWRTKDAAALDASALGGELTRYFRGLMTAVDEKKHQIKDAGAIVATATPDGARFALAAHVLDAFGAGNAVDLDGWAARRACDGGALWVFVLAPKTTAIRAQLDALAAKATCH